MWIKIKLYLKTIGIILGLIFFGIIGFLFNRKSNNDEMLEKLKKRKKELNELSKNIDNFISDSKSKGL